MNDVPGFALRVGLLVLLHVLVAGGLAAVVLGLGGNFILLGLAVLVAWAGDFHHLGWGTLLVLLGLALLGEIVESVLGLLVARGFGASRWGMIGAVLGGILGALAGTAWIPLAGSLAGAVLGSFAGALLGEMLGGKPFRPSLRAGTGALLGRGGAVFVKLILGGVIAAFTLRAAYALW
jgi:uncharacterized protein YqgC (DUF456 family)